MDGRERLGDQHPRPNPHLLEVFLDWAHRHYTLPGLAANAVIYEEEVSRPADQLPQFIPEFVMGRSSPKRTWPGSATPASDTW